MQCIFRTWKTVALCGIALVLGGPAVARAANQFDERQTTNLGRTVVTAAHPRAKEITYLDHKESTPKQGRFVLEVRMKYYGKVTSNKYTATIRITIDSGKNPQRVIDVDYKDDNKMPSNKKKLKAVEAKLTDMLPKIF
jgi:hypothetical protein